jgi:hypothetical protein
VRCRRGDGAWSGSWCAAPAPGDTPAAARRPTSSAGSPRPAAGPWASPVLCGNVLQGPHVHGQVGHHLLERAVLRFQLPQAPQLAHFQPTVLGLPPGGGAVADARCSADVGERLALFDPLPDGDDLLFAESALPPGIRSLPSWTIVAYPMDHVSGFRSAQLTRHPPSLSFPLVWPGGKQSRPRACRLLGVLRIPVRAGHG